MLGFAYSLESRAKDDVSRYFYAYKFRTAGGGDDVLFIFYTPLPGWPAEAPSNNH